MTSFPELDATKNLRKLAESAINLSDDGVLTAKRIKEMHIEGQGLSLLYATERVTKEVIEELSALSVESKALEKMQAMQAGEVINKIEGYESENRAVLHTAMRDFFDQPNESEQARTATELAYKELEKLRAFLDGIEGSEFTDLVQIGIGGSDLGPKAVYLALEAFKKEGRKVHFVSNVDPDDASNVLSSLDLQKTLVVVVSKSGTTLETKTNEEIAREFYRKSGVSPEKHVIAVTGKDSPMDDKERYREVFYIWDYVGGRYSATSMVGGVALAFSLGMDKFLEFLKGASGMDKTALKKDVFENLPLFLALIGIWNRNFLHYQTCAIIPYSQALSRFPAHLQQCDMESNGKRIDKQGHALDFNSGPLLWGEVGTNSQHSFFQLLHQGTDVHPIEFIGFKTSQKEFDLEVEGTTSQEKLLSNLFAQSLALATGQKSDNPGKVFLGNRPNLVILGDKCDPATVGALLSLYENKVAFQGFIWGINSFDQEGVQLGKHLANQLIAIFAAKREGKSIDNKEFPLGQALAEYLL